MAALENVRHETFAQEIAKGLSQRKAYRVAFPKSVNWKDETVDSKASVLAKHEKVLARINELKDLSSNEAIKTATERKIWLSRVMDDETEETTTKLKACDLLNKMEGEYVTKIEGEVKVNKLEDLL